MRNYLKLFLASVIILASFTGLASLSGCEKAAPKTIKVGVSFGVGIATRWKSEERFMHERAKELGIELESRLNITDNPRTQTEDCFEMISSGIDVLIITPRNVTDVAEIITYAHQKNVKVISYARAVMDGSVELFIGYDCYNIGQTMGKHLVEKVYKGDLIILKGDKDDFNTPLLYYGAMKYIKPLIENGDFNVLLDAYIPGWSTKQAKETVKQALLANHKQVDAIMAPNDAFAGAAIEALQELGITKKVLVTGMDAELTAVQRVAAGTQDITVYLDLKTLAFAAIDQAYNLATKKDVSVNSALEGESKSKVKAYLVNGQLVTKENIDKVLIAPGFFSKEQIYGDYGVSNL